MAQEIVGIKIVVDGQEKILSSMKDIRAELKKAQSDAVIFSETFGSTSKEATEAAQRVARLKDAIGDAKNLTDAYNPDAKFKAFSQALQGVVGGVAAVQGAIGLLGVENEAVEKTLLRVQSAMALSQGLNSVLESVDSFKTLGKQLGIVTAAQKIYNFVMGQTAVASTAATVAMRALRGIMASIGIGALIAGVTILISKISDWTSSTDSAKESNKKLNDEIDRQNKLFEKNRQALQYAKEDAILQAKIRGASAEELFKISQSYGEKDIDLAKKNAADKLKTLKDFESKNIELVNENGKLIAKGSEENIEQYKKLSKEFEDANQIKNDAIRKSNVDSQTETLRIAEDGRDKAKTLREKEEADAKKLAEEEKKKLEERVENNKKADEDIRKAKQENYLATIKDEDERAKKEAEIDLQNRILEIDALNVDESKKKELKLQAAIDTQNQLDAIDTEAKKKKEEKDKKFAEEESKNLQETLAASKTRQDAIREATSTADENELYDLTEKYRKKLELVKGNAEAEAALVQEYENIKKNIRQNALNNELSNYASAAGSISQLLGQTTAAGKAFAIAEATINTYKAASQVFAAPVPGVAPVSLAVKIATMVSAIATGIKNVKSIVATKAPGVPNGTNPPPPPAPISPSIPIQATMTQLNQGSINQLGSATNRSYVVESDITNSQERIRRINRAARLN